MCLFLLPEVSGEAAISEGDKCLLPPRHESLFKDVFEAKISEFSHFFNC